MWGSCGGIFGQGGRARPLFILFSSSVSLPNSLGNLLFSLLFCQAKITCVLAESPSSTFSSSHSFSKSRKQDSPSPCRFSLSPILSFLFLIKTESFQVIIKSRKLPLFESISPASPLCRFLQGKIKFDFHSLSFRLVEI